MFTWIFVSVSCDRFNRYESTNLNANYSWVLKIKDSKATESSGFTYAEVLLLMKHFKVTSAVELAGKSFKSKKDLSVSALEYLLVQIRHDGKYTPPSAKRVRNRAIVSLAMMECPDFTDLDGDTVYQAFREVWEGEKVSEVWLADAKAKIHRLSSGRVFLRETRNSSGHILGPISYLELVQGRKIQKLSMGPYSTPITFED